LDKKLTVSKVKFGGDDIVVTFEVALLESLSHDDLGLTFSLCGF